MYYPLLKMGNNEMKALKHLDQGTKEKVIPIIESRRVTNSEGKSWEWTFKTLGTFLKDRVAGIKFIYDFNCALEDLETPSILETTDGIDLVQHCIKKMEDQDLNFTPCFQHDSPEWLIRSVITSGFQEIAIRIRCHDFQETFDRLVLDKLRNDLKELSPETNIIVILDFYTKIVSSSRIQHAIDVFSEIENSTLVYLATSCPEDASGADAHSLTLIGPREEIEKFLELEMTNDNLYFGDYTTRLKGEVLGGFNFNNSYLKIVYSSETDFYIGKSKLMKEDGEETFHEVCQEIIEQVFYPGSHFSFGDNEIQRAADKKITISGHQAPIAIAVNHHIETTVEQLL